MRSVRQKARFTLRRIPKCWTPSSQQNDCCCHFRSQTEAYWAFNFMLSILMCRMLHKQNCIFLLTNFIYFYISSTWSKHVVLEKSVINKSFVRWNKECNVCIKQLSCMKLPTWRRRPTYSPKLQQKTRRAIVSLNKTRKMLASKCCENNLFLPVLPYDVLTFLPHQKHLSGFMQNISFQNTLL